MIALGGKNLISKIFDAATFLREAVIRNKVDFATLIAETSIWANPVVVQLLLEKNRSPVWYSNRRRGRIAQGETKGKEVNEIKIDDNTYANNAIKMAIGVSRKSVIGFETCHIWPDTCYDEKYHTAIPNLVLIPRAIASLSDYDEGIRSALQYRAFELYNWYPDNYGCPTKPEGYPTTWREPEPFSNVVRKAVLSRFGETQIKQTDLDVDKKSSKESNQMLSEEERLIKKIEKWAKMPSSIVHKTIALVSKANNGISRKMLVSEASKITGSRNSYGTVSSLLTSKGKAYGRVFIEIDGTVSINPNLQETVKRFNWSI